MSDGDLTLEEVETRPKKRVPSETAVELEEVQTRRMRASPVDLTIMDLEVVPTRRRELSDAGFEKIATAHKAKLNAHIRKKTDEAMLDALGDANHEMRNPFGKTTTNERELKDAVKEAYRAAEEQHLIERYEDNEEAGSW